MDLLSLAVKFSLDKKEYEQGLTDAESEAYSAGQKIGTGMKGIGSTVAGAIGGLAKITAAGITATTGAAIAITKKAIGEYSEYQQLLGGVQKLYGTAGQDLVQYAHSVGKTTGEVKDKFFELQKAQELVLQNAENAYKTAGMSTKQYMETATSFSAALINSLEGDTVKAAEQTDKAMRAISDNYNTFGGDMANIEHAFQGFAKQNYTMLDNLKLGYGGTKEEMARLIADANEYAKANGMAADLSIESFSDIVTAIDLVQQKQNIAGTTAREAATTISGSLGMLKGAWQNLVAGLADPDADISKLIDNVVDSIVGYTDEAGNHINGFLDNIIPTIKQATTGLVQLVSEAIPALAAELPSLLQDTLPMLIQAGIDLFNGLVAALPTVMQVLFDQLPTIIQAVIDAVIELLPMVIELGFTFLEALATGFLEALPEILPKITQLIMDIVAMFTDAENLSNFLDAAVEIIITLAQGLIEALPVLIPAVIDIILTIVEKLTEPDNIIMLIEAAVQIILAIAKGLIAAIPRLIEAIPVLISNIVGALLMALPTISEGALELFGGLLKGFLAAIPQLLAQIPILIVSLLESLAKGIGQLFKMGVKLVKAIADGIKNLDPIQWGKDLIQKFIDGLLAKWNDLKNTVKNIAGSIADFLGFSEPKLGPLSNFHTYAPDMMELFAKGIEDNKQMLLDTVSDAFDFSDMIVGPVAETESTNTDSKMSEMLRMLKQLVESDRNVTVVLEGDADRIFRVVQSEARRNNQLTGQTSFA